MGLGALGELQMRSRGANGRSHTSLLSLYFYVSRFYVSPLSGTLVLAALDDDTVDWLKRTATKI